MAKALPSAVLPGNRYLFLSLHLQSLFVIRPCGNHSMMGHIHMNESNYTSKIFFYRNCSPNRVVKVIVMEFNRNGTKSFSAPLRTDYRLNRWVGDYNQNTTNFRPKTMLNCTSKMVGNLSQSQRIKWHATLRLLIDQLNKQDVRANLSLNNKNHINFCWKVTKHTIVKPFDIFI